MQDDATKAVLDVELAGLVLDLSLLRIVAAQVSSSKAEMGEGPLRGPSSIGAVEQRSTAPAALAAAGCRCGTSLDPSAGLDVLAGVDLPTSGGMIVEVVPFGAHGRCSMPHPDVLPAPAWIRPMPPEWRPHPTVDEAPRPNVVPVFRPNPTSEREVPSPILPTPSPVLAFTVMDCPISPPVIRVALPLSVAAFKAACCCG